MPRPPQSCFRGYASSADPSYGWPNRETPVRRTSQVSLEDENRAMFTLTLIALVFVILSIASIWFGVDSRDHGAHARQW